jgi:hypothetical protein
MRLPAVIWAFLGLTVIALTIYALSLGVFIGSEAVFLKMSDGSGWYTYQCRYLHLTGVRRHLDPGIIAPSPEDAAARGSCPVFGKTSNRL